jgi:hypothetical protein
MLQSEMTASHANTANRIQHERGCSHVKHKIGDYERDQFALFGSADILPAYLGQAQGYNAESGNAFTTTGPIRTASF